MDAYGNLTDISEFTDGLRIRLISYMNEDVAAGGFGDMNDYSDDADFWLAVRRLSQGDPETSVFLAEKSTDFTFYLGWSPLRGWRPQGDEDGIYLNRGAAEAHNGAVPLAWLPSLTTPGPLAYHARPSDWTVDFVYGCWFTLNTVDKQLVLDVRESDQTEGNAITLFPSNGGANQIWRAAALSGAP